MTEERKSLRFKTLTNYRYVRTDGNTVAGQAVLKVTAANAFRAAHKALDVLIGQTSKGIIVSVEVSASVDHGGHTLNSATLEVYDRLASDPDAYKKAKSIIIPGRDPHAAMTKRLEGYLYDEKALHDYEPPQGIDLDTLAAWLLKGGDVTMD